MTAWPRLSAPLARSRLSALAAAVAVLATACGGGDGGGAAGDARGYAALPANFDLAANSPQAFLVAVFGPEHRAVAYGTAAIALSFLGPPGRPLPEPRAGPVLSAVFQPAAGQPPAPADQRPRLLEVTETAGVYATEPVTFPDPGYWEATVTVAVAGRTRRMTAAFEVLDRHRVPAVGDAAPDTDNPTLGTPGVPPQALDSRAGSDGTVPDADLHRASIAGALAAHRPLVVVISTPAFCESRLCGPVTDAVAALAPRYRDQVDFVHLEVYADGQQRRLNPAAAAWIQRDGADGNEPWVFVVNRDGRITDRFDNVANEAQIDAALRRMLG
ncbi:MAG: hypothetical protein ACLGI2_07880 [Acidimicrobiia bacterium]